MWVGGQVAGILGYPMARKQPRKLRLLPEWAERGFWQCLEMLKAGLCAELGESSTWKCVTLPIRPHTHARQRRNPRKGKRDGREEQRESVEVDVETSVLWQTSHHLCKRIKNNHRTNPISPRMVQAKSGLETSLKTMRCLKLLLCPSPSPGNSLRSQLGGTPG